MPSNDFNLRPGVNSRTNIQLLPVGTKLISANKLALYEAGQAVTVYTVTEHGVAFGSNSLTRWRSLNERWVYTVIESAEAMFVVAIRPKASAANPRTL